MAAITIKDLPTNRALDLKAMSSIRGAAGEWVFGWITSYSPAQPGVGFIANFYQITNNFFADQMINQFQVVNVNNSAPNSTVSATAAEGSKNFKQQ